ncbi:anti-sigma-D factor RsdA [Mycobacterium sp. OTB74]|jgi:hypothetical protein|uniref:anti-sigma-D factor RsdA n=1 Tax=Mycobacterium sp. OTB74 TaxID=1853452 RepID=UPI002474583E|nr:anti-sigma-D factor RsdA [Mycobacterium sp. OTB74]MDH6247793.1 hypothetical protein [Mycobacterium sp. OTB74]
MPDFGRWTSNGGDPSLNEINRADRFLDALAANQPPYSTDGTEAELAFLLADWRDSVREPAVTTPVTARDAVAALQNGLAKKHSRGTLTIAGSIAAALLCLGGFGTAVYGAGPGDALYGVRTTLFGAPRVSDEQVMLAAQTEMQQVQQMIDNGQWQQAQDKLQQLSPTVQSVDTPEHKQQLIQQWNALTYKVVEQNSAATLPPPGEPMPTLPSSPLTLLPVPVVQPPSASVTTSTTSTTPTTESTSAPSTTSTTATSTTASPTTATSTTATPTTSTSGAPTVVPGAGTPTTSTDATATSTTVASTPTSPAETTTATPTTTAAPTSATPTTTAGPAPAATTPPVEATQTAPTAASTTAAAPTVASTTAAAQIPTTTVAAPTQAPANTAAETPHSVQSSVTSQTEPTAQSGHSGAQH